MAKTAAELVTGALERARGRSVLVHYLATSVGGDATYAVGSADPVDAAYRVTCKAGEYRCTCPAGDAGRRCWHQAAVYTLRANRCAWGLAPDGPAPGQAAPLGRATPRRLPPRDDAA